MKKIDWVIKARKLLGLNITQAAELIGIQRAYLSNIENGNTKLTNDYFFRIMKAYNYELSINISKNGHSDVIL